MGIASKLRQEIYLMKLFTLLFNPDMLAMQHSELSRRFVFSVSSKQDGNCLQIAARSGKATSKW